MKKIKLTATALAAILAISSCGGAPANTAKEDNNTVSSSDEVKASGTTVTNNDKSDTKAETSQQKETEKNDTADEAQTDNSSTNAGSSDNGGFSNTNIGANGVPIIEHMGGYNEIGALENGLVLVTRNKGFYIADASGNVVSEIIDDEAQTTRLGNDSFFHGRKLYDKNCNVIIDPETMGFDDYLTVQNDYVVVYKIDSGFSGDTVSLGVIDTKGNWIRELSDKAKIFDYDIDKNAIKELNHSDYLRLFYDDSDGSFYIIASLYRENANYDDRKFGFVVYDVLKDEIVCECEDPSKTFIRVPYSWFFTDSGAFYIDSHSVTGYSKRLDTLAQTFYSGNSLYRVPGGALYVSEWEGKAQENGEWVDRTNVAGLYSPDGQYLVTLQGIELVDYVKYLVYSSGCGAFIAKGKDSGCYFCVTDKNGTVFEPVKIIDSSSFEVEDFSYFSLDENGIVFQNYRENTLYAVDLKGNVKKIDTGAMKVINYNLKTGDYALRDNYNDVHFYNESGEQLFDIGAAW